MSPTPAEQGLLRRLGFAESADKPGLYKRSHIEGQGTPKQRRWLCVVDYRQGATPDLYGAEHGVQGTDKTLAERLPPLIEFRRELLQLTQKGLTGNPAQISAPAGQKAGPASSPAPPPGREAPKGETAPGARLAPIAPGAGGPPPSNIEPKRPENNADAGGTKGTPVSLGEAPSTPPPARGRHYFSAPYLQGQWLRGFYGEADRRRVEQETIQRNLDLLQECAAAYLLRYKPQKAEGDHFRGILALYEGVRRHAHHEAEAWATERLYEAIRLLKEKGFPRPDFVDVSERENVSDGEAAADDRCPVCHGHETISVQGTGDNTDLHMEPCPACR